MKLKALIVATFLIAYSASAATQGQKLPGDDLSIPSVDEKWGAVAFTHQKHLAYSDCTYCHHTNKGLTLEVFNGGKADKVPLCSECHIRAEGDAKSPKNADGTELWSKEAYHTNCIDCHKGEITKKPKDAGAIKKQGEGPTKCDNCHVKKE